MTTGRTRRVNNNVDGHTKLVLEVLCTTHEEYIDRRNKLIHKLNKINKMTHRDLAYKFSMSKSNIGRICKMIEESYNQ